jgi:hypothetical protein
MERKGPLLRHTALPLVVTEVLAFIALTGYSPRRRQLPFLPGSTAHAAWNARVDELHTSLLAMCQPAATIERLTVDAALYLLCPLHDLAGGKGTFQEQVSGAGAVHARRGGRFALGIPCIIMCARVRILLGDRGVPTAQTGGVHWLPLQVTAHRHALAAHQQSVRLYETWQAPSQLMEAGTGRRGNKGKQWLPARVDAKAPLPPGPAPQLPGLERFYTPRCQRWHGRITACALSRYDSSDSDGGSDDDATGGGAALSSTPLTPAAALALMGIPPPAQKAPDGLLQWDRTKDQAGIGTPSYVKVFLGWRSNGAPVYVRVHKLLLWAYAGPSSLWHPEPAARDSGGGSGSGGAAHGAPAGPSGVHGGSGSGGAAGGAPAGPSGGHGGSGITTRKGTVLGRAAARTQPLDTLLIMHLCGRANCMCVK